MSAGCLGLPVRRVDRGIDPRQATAERPEYAPPLSVEPEPGPLADQGVPLPPLPLQPVSDREALGPPSATPLLDLALQRAEAVKAAVASESADPAPDAAVLSQATTLIETPPVLHQETVAQPGGTEHEADKTNPPRAIRTNENAATSPPESLRTVLAEPAPPAPLVIAPVSPTPAADPGSVPSPASGDPWRDGLSRLRQIAQKRAAGDPASARVWEIREHILANLAESPSIGIDSLNPEESLWRAVASALAEADAVASTEAVGATLSPLRAAAIALELEAPLEIVELQFCRRVLGFGDFEPVADHTFTVGQSIVLYCDMAGLRYERAGDRFRSRIESRVEVMPAQGDSILWGLTLGAAEDTCQRPRRDYYVNYRLNLPTSLASGDYRLRLSQKDTISGQEVARELSFSLR
jgi:hypothetical protein